jgi:hypothetical protein
MLSGVSRAADRRPDVLDPVRADIRLKDFTGASARLTQLAAGNAEAQYLLGVFYLNGLGWTSRFVASAPIAREGLRSAGATALHHNTPNTGEFMTVIRPLNPEPDLYAHWPDVAVAAVTNTLGRSAGSLP